MESQSSSALRCGKEPRYSGGRLSYEEPSFADRRDEGEFQPSNRLPMRTGLAVSLCSVASIPFGAD